MATTNLAPELRKRYWNAAGTAALAGGKLYTYQAGTTTPQAVYTDNTTTTPHTNPIVLDANGEISANVWLDPTLSYKFVLKDSSDVTQWTLDNIVGTLSNDSVGTVSIQNSAVTTAKIADANVTLAKLASQCFGPGTLLNYSLAAAVASNALTITLNDASGAAPSATSPVKALFRNTTLTSGVPVERSITSALTATISNGSTAGSVSGKANWIYVYLADDGTNRGVAWSASKMWDEGTLYNITIEGGAGAADSKTTLYADAAMTNAAIRLIGRIKSTQATAGVWATAPSEISLVPFEQRSLRSEVWVYTGNGYGSVNTAIRRFTTTGKNVGSAITYADSATAGGSFTINEDGLYAISYSDSLNAAQGTIGVTVNSTELTTNVAALVDPTALRLVSGQAAATDSGLCSGVLFLQAGDVVRAHTDLTAQSASTTYMHFRITKVSD